MPGLWRVLSLLGLIASLLACATPPGISHVATEADTSELLIVAVPDRAEPLLAAGASPRTDYRRLSTYAGSDRAHALAAELAQTYGLTELSAWTIAPLDWRCMLYRVAPGADRAALLTRLAADSRVQLAQPLNQFETRAANPAYNDPYIGLQQGFASIDAAPVQRKTRGEQVRIALIDSGVDAAHPELAGRILQQRDFVGDGLKNSAERHGTEMAGIIAAGANNHIGIVGMAPQASLLAYRACWTVAGGARCNSFTLAQALGAAIGAGADIINLSLGGPRDALLERLTAHAIQRGTVVVGAVPPSGLLEGFPAAVPGVIAVAPAEDGRPAAGVVAAPGRHILTLTPGGHYDYASGSSLATAHVSGAVALLRALDRSLSPVAAKTALLETAEGSVNVCKALQRLRADPALVCR